MSNVMLNRIKKIVEERQSEERTAIVFKGIPIVSFVDEEPNLDEIDKNRLQYFISSVNSRKVYSYEEFLLLNSFFIDQYKRIYIVENNLYMNLYPAYLNCSEETINGLLTHFSQEESIGDDAFIGDIKSILDLFTGVKRYNDYYLATYNDSKVLEQYEKVITIPLFEESSNMDIVYSECNEEVFNITNEEDYIGFLRYLFQQPTEVSVCIDDYFEDKNLLKSKLQLISEHWIDYTDIYFVKKKEDEKRIECSEDILKILKKYWGYDRFRTLKMYDFQKLDSGEKEIIEVSQERIIGDIVNQIEKCVDGSDQARDIFVTAPTGAGKSVMFQIPAIYAAEKHNLLTIVISPLIGLMNDQVKNLETKNYSAAKTINSDISPIIKQEIMQKVSDCEYHILYISPETLLSRSDVEQLIGDRAIGMIVIDEAHIVTTWGKQFRPDYWYLGDHIRKIRKNQIKKKQQSFVIATFTATAIFKGIEDMYSETIYSLNMISPITYLGYVKRDDIDIVINKHEKKKDERDEYEDVKLDEIKQLINNAVVFNEKTLIYFPTVVLIDRCFESLHKQGFAGPVAIYHASLTKEEKQEYYEMFLSGEKKVMLATKAFGMGIDIDDIQIVAHFAPTGNVCDYVQEIGRAARKPSLKGKALYNYNKFDFRHINRLHGLSMIKEYQLVEVIKKIVEIYKANSKNSGNNFTRRRNAMLVDAENFSYIFGFSEHDTDNINKVKTALLIIQKDFERRGFSPVNVRPIPLFAMGYFKISKKTQEKIKRQYPNALTIECEKNEICQLNLEKIWEKSYSMHSFAKFKYLLYSKSNELDFVEEFPMDSALCVDIMFSANHRGEFSRIWDPIKGLINLRVRDGDRVYVDDMINYLEEHAKISRYKATPICEVLLATISVFNNEFSRKKGAVTFRPTNAGKISYGFDSAINEFINWVEKKYQTIIGMVNSNTLYLVNDYGTKTKEISTVLGLLEAMGVLSFKMIGGANSQLYIYINQVQGLDNIVNKPSSYRNRLLEVVNDRHLISVKMLTYIYENNFTSDEIWELIENYFLGVIPEEVKNACKKENPKIRFDD